MTPKGFITEQAIGLAVSQELLGGPTLIVVVQTSLSKGEKVRCVGGSARSSDRLPTLAGEMPYTLGLLPLTFHG